MRPFNLEEAKAGKSIVSRYSRKARVIAFDRTTVIGPQLVALILDEAGDHEECVGLSIDGRYNYGYGDSEFDLFME